MRPAQRGREYVKNKLLHIPIFGEWREEKDAKKGTEYCGTTGCNDDENVWRKVDEGSSFFSRHLSSQFIDRTRASEGKEGQMACSSSPFNLSDHTHTDTHTRIYRLIEQIIRTARINLIVYTFASVFRAIYLAEEDIASGSTFAFPRSSSTEIIAWDRQHLDDKCVKMCSPVDNRRTFFSLFFLRLIMFVFHRDAPAG